MLQSNHNSFFVSNRLPVGLGPARCTHKHKLHNRFAATSGLGPNLHPHCTPFLFTYNRFLCIHERVPWVVRLPQPISVSA